MVIGKEAGNGKMSSKALRYLACWMDGWWSRALRWRIIMQVLKGTSYETEGRGVF